MGLRLIWVKPDLSIEIPALPILLNPIDHGKKTVPEEFPSAFTLLRIQRFGNSAVPRPAIDCIRSHSQEIRQLIPCDELRHFAVNQDRR